MIEYFTQANPPFGNVSVVMALLWLATLAFGAYLLRSYRSANRARLAFARQVAVVTIALSALGLVLLALKYANVAVLEWRLWGYLVALASLGYWGYALWYYNSKLPAQAAAQGARPARLAGGRGARAYQTNGAPSESRAPREPRPIATTTRRAARREKKRKAR